MINLICNEVDFYNICPKTVNRNGYLWQEYISHTPVDSHDEFHIVYYNYGFILSITDMLNINDCHFDNFIVKKDKPYFIDSETSLQYYHDNVVPDFERSILQTGLIQKQDALTNGMGYTSAITCVTNQFQSYTYPHAVDDGTENIKVSFEKGYYRKTKNYPYYNNEPADVNKYTEDIIRGYSVGFRSLLSSRDNILRIITNLQKKLNVRLIVRRT